MNYTKHDLQQLDTIEQSWDGDELKIDDGDIRVWLSSSENRKYNGDYTIETKVNGRWEQQACLFNFEYKDLPYMTTCEYSGLPSVKSYLN